MVVTPDSEIYLIKSPLKLDNNNQITFSNTTAQYNYFSSLPKLTHQAFSYIRKDGVVRIPTHASDGDGLPTYEDLLEYNYCMYKNTHYKNKWFYAFITDIIYQNDGMSTITLETDVFQSWQFDLVYMNSFIEREHVSDDTIGLHTLPEGIEHGPYIASYYDELTDWKYETSKVIVGTTWLPTNTPGMNPGAQVYGGVMSGVYYMAMTASNAKNFLDAMAGFGRSSNIVTVFMAPDDVCVNLTSFSATLHSKINNDDGTTSFHDFAISGSFVGNNLGGNIIFDNKTITVQTTLNGYTPKNNKMYCFPFNYLLVTNNQGTNAEFHYEDFINNTPTFRCIGTLSPGCSIKLFPVNYKKLADSSANKPGFNEGIMAGKFPICSWQNDSYVNWLTQQSVNTKLGIVSGLAQIGGMLLNSDAGVGNSASSYGSLFNQQARYISERYQHALVGPQASGNINGGDVSFAYGEGNFGVYKMTIKAEYAKICDDFLSQFGYQVNRLATPNINKRSNWDYMKTTSVNLEGNIPEKDLDKIRSLFNNGCTFWHTTTYFLDYSRTNSIV